MPEQERDERMNEAIALLSRLSPEGLSVDRDRLFFRAGEASARGEGSAKPRWEGAFWPAAAAVMAFVAAGLGVALARHEPEVRIVYVERPAIENDGRANLPKEKVSHSLAVERHAHDAESTYQRSAGQRAEWLSQGDGLIHPQDRAALSEAFDRQLGLQRERIEAHKAVAMGDDGQPEAESDGVQTMPRTYLEIRRAMRAM